MDCQRCGGPIVRRRTGPEGSICERCYSRAYHRKKIEARCAAQLQAVLDVVASVAPDVERAAIAGAIERAAPTELEQKRALEYLLAVPDALSTGSPHLPQVVARLAAELVSAGAAAVVRPACPRCGRVVDLLHPTVDGRVCARCYAVGRAAECGLCGERRRITTRTPDGLPMCSSCRNRDPSRWEACVGCNRTRPVNARTEDGGALCNTCYRQPGLPCDACGKVGMIVSRKGGGMLCTRCYRHPTRPCGRCGRVRRVALRAKGDQPDLCPACHWAAVAVCVRCGDEGPSRGVQKGEPVCLRCLAVARLDEVLTGDDGRIPEALTSLRDVIISTEQPRTLSVWLDRSPGVAVLRGLVTGEVAMTHEGLDALHQNASLNHLRQLLVACGALPERDPNLARLERSIERLIAALDHAEDRQLLRAFARWRVLRRARSRADKGGFTAIRAKNARTVVAEAARFLAWLRGRGLSLSDCSQADVELWLATGVEARRRIGEFLRWARAQRAVGDVSVPVAGTGAAPRSIDAEARWAMARRLIHDESLDMADRVVGTLVVLYAQPVTRVARLRRSDVVEEDGQTFIKLGRELMAIPEPLGTLLRTLPWRRQVGPSGKVEAASEWLFPGRQAGLPLHPEYIRRRMGELGIECRASRNAALLQLGSRLPAAVLADKFDIHRTTADRWVKTAGGDWARYAAERAGSS